MSELRERPSLAVVDPLPQLSRLRELRTPRVGCLFDLDRGEDILWCVDCHQLERPRAIKLAQTCANLHAILQPDEKAGVGSPAHGRAARAPLALVRRAHAARDPMPVSVGRGPPLSYSWLEVAAEGWRGRRAPPTPATSIADWITGRPSRQLLRSRLRSPDGCDGSTVCGICPAGQTPLAAIRRDASPSLLGPVG